MYEVAIMRALIRKLEGIAAENGSADIENVYVQIGPLSETDPELLECAFERLPKCAALRRARLVVEHVPLLLRCECCHAILESNEPSFACPACGSESTTVLRGDSVVLEGVTLARPPIWDEETVIARALAMA